MSARLNILWSCDVPGWAYHNRIVRKSRAMPQHDHVTFFVGGNIPIIEKAGLINMADVIICQGLKALRIKKYKFSRLKQLNNVVLRLDSMRIDINGEYIDLW